MRFSRLFAIAGLLLTTSFAVSQAQTSVTIYNSEDAANRACKNGVVWVNIKTKVFHSKGDQYYGKTKEGAYACHDVAVRAGLHEDTHH